MRFLKNFSIVLLYFIIFLTIINFLPKTINFLNAQFYKNTEKTILDFKLITHLNKDFKKNDLEKKPSIFFLVLQIVLMYVLLLYTRFLNQ